MLNFDDNCVKVGPRNFGGFFLCYQGSLERDNSKELALVQIAPKMNITV